MKTHYVYFSASGTTQKVISIFADAMGGQPEPYDLLRRPQKTDAKKCIACTACMAACPQHARGFHVPVVFPAAAKSFAKNNAERKEPEIFL